MIRAENALEMNNLHEERNKLSLCRQEALITWKPHFKNNHPACYKRYSRSSVQLMPSAYPLRGRGPSQATPGARMRTSNLILPDTSISILIWKILMKWIL